MSDNKNKPLPVTEYYNDLYELHGAVMDAESYARHKEADPSVPAVESAAPVEHASEPLCPSAPVVSDSQPEVTLDTVFSEPQDLRQIAAKQMEADRRIEYRPECVTYVIPRFTGETCIETETRMVFDTPHMIRCGSGSYITSGSYGSYVMVSSYKTSGSYLIHTYHFNQNNNNNNNNNRGSGSYRSSGSFRFRTSGSYRGSGSFRLSSFRTSGSYRGRSSFRLSSGSYRLSSQCFCIPAQAEEDKPYMGSFGWDFDLGGYGLDLI